MTIKLIILYFSKRKLTKLTFIDQICIKPRTSFYTTWSFVTIILSGGYFPLKTQILYLFRREGNKAGTKNTSKHEIITQFATNRQNQF